MIRGLSHVTFSVSDVGRSVRFYRDVVGLRLVARWMRGAYFLAGREWIALSLDPETRGGPLPEYSHVAFAVSGPDFAPTAQRIHDSGTVVFKENRSEGASVYFLDPDGHKLEIHASGLEERLTAMRAEEWEGAEFFEP